jgi:hypothetical protein
LLEMIEVGTGIGLLKAKFRKISETSCDWQTRSAPRFDFF